MMIDWCVKESKMPRLTIAQELAVVCSDKVGQCIRNAREKTTVVI
jgi:hypothetical protein